MNREIGRFELLDLIVVVCRLLGNTEKAQIIESHLTMKERYNFIEAISADSDINGRQDIF